MKKRYLSFLLFFLALPLWTESRAFDSIFPGLSPEIRKTVFSDKGYLKSVNAAAVNNLIGSSPNGLNPDIAGIILTKKPNYYVESLLVIPGSKSLLEAYNALGKIQDLKGRVYQSHTKGDNVPLFEDATRIESINRSNPIPDPPPASVIPKTDTVFIKLKDTNFGNSYYRGDMRMDNNGLRYSLSNFKNLSFMLIPVIKEEKFSAQLYFEVIEEGILVYSIANAEVSDFVASKIDMPSAIRKRLEVLISWVVDGLKN